MHFTLSAFCQLFQCTDTKLTFLNKVFARMEISIQHYKKHNSLLSLLTIEESTKVAFLLVVSLQQHLNTQVSSQYINKYLLLTQ